MPRILIPILNRVARLLERAADRLHEASWRVSYCPVCGRNRYTGAPCYGRNDP